MTSRLAGRTRGFSVIVAVGLMIVLTACTSGTASSTAAPSPISRAQIERVLTSARVILVTYAPAPAGPPPTGAQPARTESVTVTDPARVRRVAALIDGLSLASPGEEWACPAFTGGVMNLAFRTSAGGRTLAAANVDMSGCPGMVLTIAGATQSLNIPSDTIPPRVLLAAGISPVTAN